MALVARTREIADPGPLVGLLPTDHPMTWLRNGEGIVCWGTALTHQTSGPTRFTDASAWWQEVCDEARVDDELQLPGTGLICMGSFAFADAPGASTVVVPRVVVGRRGDHTWLTLIGPETETSPELMQRPELMQHDEPPAPASVAFADGSRSAADWEGAVWEAVIRINAGELEKVVMARDLIATATNDIDVRWPIRRLAEAYDMCWTFHVDGMVGATPELLVRRERGLVTSRVLAGTIRRTGDDVRDVALAGQLARSSKDLEEHEYAVRSVAEALQPHCTSMNVPEVPFVLHLPNVMHLATDVTGVVDPSGANLLELAAALHPSAAVGGTPTKTAVDLIDQIEGMDRGRYAGPVGWFDANGDGEFGIALRSAHVSGNKARLFAGCGIVANSDPEAELAESQAKLVPVRDALSG
ncbi:MAG TPA: isochorismate synthase [Marmoricola sp.]|nr:isochorismate synthase [Nocardioidaceae bacterium]HRV68639.1 isochorismate synthase [Marmoricola sp.]